MKMEMQCNWQYVFLVLCLWFTEGYGIGCYTCHSETRNTTVGPCGDPFNSSHVTYTSDCMQGIKGRTGEFPAHFCIKMEGTSVIDSTRIFVRTCSITTMGHQCGEFKFGEPPVRYKGCLSSCDNDACNTGALLSKNVGVLVLSILLLAAISKGMV